MWKPPSAPYPPDPDPEVGVPGVIGVAGLGENGGSSTTSLLPPVPLIEHFTLVSERQSGGVYTGRR